MALAIRALVASLLSESAGGIPESVWMQLDLLEQS